MSKNRTEPYILIKADDPEKKPQLYGCSLCGNVYSPIIYVANHKTAHAAAYEAAATCWRCRKSDICSQCGVDTPKGHTMCVGCREEKMLNAALEIEDNGGPYFDFFDEKMYHDLEDAAEDGIEWVCPTTTTLPSIKAWDIIDSLMEEMPEDFDESDLVGVDKLKAAIDEFNQTQTTKAYWGDNSRKIRVPVVDMKED